MAAEAFPGPAASVPSIGDTGVMAATGSGPGFPDPGEPGRPCPCLPKAQVLWHLAKPADLCPLRQAPSPSQAQLPLQLHSMSVQALPSC